MERLLKSKFKIGEKIGENLFSLTYRGTTLSGEQPVIIKIYKRGTLNSVLIKSMKEKVKALQGIESEGIALLLDGDYGWQGFYYVREFVVGQNLRDFLKNHNPDPQFALDLVYKIAGILSDAHKIGIIHGALKPTNIFIKPDNKVVVSDFIIEGDIRESMPQKAQYILAESDYASPEEILGMPARPSSDAYSLGILLYEMLTGSVPFKGLPLEKISQTAKLPPAPKHISDLLSKCLEKDCLMRFKSMDELLESINNRTLFENKKAVPMVELENAPRPEEKVIIVERKEQKRSFFLAIVVLLAVLAGVIYSIIYSQILAGQ
ncbi:MAG: serine/threonine protein kinase bacterial [Candidatus Saganbacteria bacterium]|uniref:Serine/threonine protein kinase bacterial n=1 Tax=Candidatus Saganbacteria bacterium TaxID=2575572 RepID=A0A833L1Q6_UNCSA|nr:MAG: serine/threonine protein kinase bacterial [Candidatus Saganbacteria bacterium]